MLGNAPDLAPTLTIPARCWRLDIDAGRLQALAEVWSGLSRSTERTNVKIEPAARKLTECWEGSARDAYDAHRIELGASLQEVGAATAAVATAFTSLAGAVTVAGRELSSLLESAHGLARVEVAGDALKFHPHNQGAAHRVMALAAEADTVRSIAEQALQATTSAVTAHLAKLTDVARVWAPRAGIGTDALLGGINYAKPRSGHRPSRGGSPEDEGIIWGGPIRKPKVPEGGLPPQRPLPAGTFPPGWDDPDDGNGDEADRQLAPRLDAHSPAAAGPAEDAWTTLIRPAIRTSPGPILGPNLLTGSNPTVTRDPPGPIIYTPRGPGSDPDWPYGPDHPYPYPQAPPPAPEPDPDE